jgi:hypothetical protein
MAPPLTSPKPAVAAKNDLRSNRGASHSRELTPTAAKPEPVAVKQESVAVVKSNVDVRCIIFDFLSHHTDRLIACCSTQSRPHKHPKLGNLLHL